MEWISHQNFFAAYYESVSITTKFLFPIPVMMTFSVPCSDNLCNAKICLAYSAVQVPTVGIFLEHLAAVKIFVYLFN